MSSSTHLNYTLMVIITFTSIYTLPAVSTASIISPKPRSFLEYFSSLQNTPITQSKINEFIINIPHNQQVLIELAVNSKYSYEAQYQQYGMMFEFNGSENRFSLHSTQLVGTFIPVKLIRKGNLSKDSAYYPSVEDDENASNNMSNDSLESYSIFVIPLSQKFVCAFDCYGNGECQSDNTCWCKDNTYTKDSNCQISGDDKVNDVSMNGSIYQVRRSPGVEEEDKNNKEDEVIGYIQNQFLGVSRHASAYVEAVPSEYLEQVAKIQQSEEIKEQEIQNNSDIKDTQRILLNDNENNSKSNMLEQIQESHIALISLSCLLVAFLAIGAYVIINQTKKQNQLLSSGNTNFNDQLIYSSV